MAGTQRHLGVTEEASIEEHPDVPAPGLLPFLERHGTLRYFGFSLAALGLVALLRLSNPTVPDPDSFYHFRYAALYAEKGLTVSAFPWLVYSIISQFSSDIGYGFHLVLVPFTFLHDPVLGLKLAAVFETVAVMILFYYVMRRHEMVFAFAWPFVLIFVAPPMVWTVLQTRPQTLTMGFSALLLSFLLAGSAWGVFIASFLIGLVHLNITPIVPVVVIVVAMVKGLIERQWEWQKWLMVLAGVCVGWLLRPNPLGTARLEYVQILVHEIVRQKKIPLLFGREWLPVSTSALAAFSYFILIWIAVAAVLMIAVAVRRSYLTRKDHSFLWSSLALSVVFFAATVAITKRTTPIWDTFAVMFIAKAFTCLLNPLDQRREQFIKRDTRLLLAISVAAVCAVMVYDGLDQHLVQGQWRGIPPDRLKAVSYWLKDHGRPGEIVFNVNWDAFPELFFWNSEQRYVSGLDPMFLFAYDQGLYWKTHHLQTGEGTDYTWGTSDYQDNSREDTYAALRGDFKASYVVLDKLRNEGLFRYMQRDPRFRLGFQDAGSAVFVVAAPRTK